MAFELPDLPYAHDALSELGMSKETLEYHHDLHHKAYVDNGNKLIDGTEWSSKTLEKLQLEHTKRVLSHRMVFLIMPLNIGTMFNFGR